MGLKKCCNLYLILKCGTNCISRIEKSKQKSHFWPNVAMQQLQNDEDSKHYSARLAFYLASFLLCSDKKEN